MTNLRVFPSDECVYSSVPQDRDGYGRLPVKGGKHEFAHRLTYRLFKGSIPHGYVIMHTCDNPSCCNPNHLIAATQKANVADSLRKGRRPQNPAISRKMDIEDVIKIRTQEQGVDSSILSKKYSVTTQTIRNIKKGKTWAGVFTAQGGSNV